MIISRTPLRISFFGGGTDYPVFYGEHGGAVLSTTINKYSYVIVRRLPPFFDYNYRIRYTQREETKTIDEIKHPSVRECLRFIGLDYGIEVQHNADLPAMSGIGSSSAFTVGLLNALYALKGQLTTKRQLALEAIHIEQDVIKEAVGSQDQAAAAFGGFNRIEFGGRRRLWVQPLTLDPAKVQYLQDRLLLVFTGFPRQASIIADEQIKRTPDKVTELTRMKEMVDEAAAILDGDIAGYDGFGRLLHEGWLLKRNLTEQITNADIDDIYETARSAGALGGKLLGAGSGGFMLLYASPDAHAKIRERLKKLLYVPFHFNDLGSQIVYYAPEQNY